MFQTLKLLPAPGQMDLYLRSLTPDLLIHFFLILYHLFQDFSRFGGTLQCVYPPKHIPIPGYTAVHILDFQQFLCLLKRSFHAGKELAFLFQEHLFLFF